MCKARLGLLPQSGTAAGRRVSLAGPMPKHATSAVIESSATSLRATRAAEAHVAQAATAGRPRPESSWSKPRLGVLSSRPK